MSNHDRKKRPPSRKLLRQFEQHALRIRRDAGVGVNGRFDPFTHNQDLHVQIAYPDDVEALPGEVKRTISSMDASTWSGGAWPERLPDGNALVMLNPNQTQERARITVMEEVAHLYYKHKPTSLSMEQGIPRQHYSERDEQEAYWTGAAVLLPSKGVAVAVWLGMSSDDLASAYGTSVELADMRIKTLGLWKHHSENKGPSQTLPQ